MKKLVDGKVVDMTAAEVAAFEAEANLPPPVPQVISRRQGIQQLIIEGLIDEVQPLIDGIEAPLDRRLAQAYWDESTEFEREHGMVIRIGYGLGKDDAGLDDMFKNASKL